MPTYHYSIILKDQDLTHVKPYEVKASDLCVANRHLIRVVTQMAESYVTHHPDRVLRFAGFEQRDDSYLTDAGRRARDNELNGLSL